MRRLLFILPALLFAILAAYFAIALTSGRDPQLIPSAMIDKPVPAFDLAALDSGPGLAPATLGGQVSLINFFASWCVPCRAENPMLMRLARDEKLPIYGINYKDKPGDARKFLAELGNPYRAIGVDADGRTGIDFGVYGVPETYVVDAAGRIRYRQVGPFAPDMLRDTVLPLIAKLKSP